MPIHALLFDAGGTIVFPKWSRVADVLFEAGVSVDPGALARAEVRARLAMDQPHVPGVSTDRGRWHRYLRSVLSVCGIPEPPAAALEQLEAFHREHNLWDLVPADVVPALTALAARWRLAVVSNSNGTVRKKLERVGLSKFFEVVVDSDEEGVEKPDPRIFGIALERMGRGARAAESAYVGDLYHVDVVGARAAGLAAVLLDPEGLHEDKPCTRVARLADLGAVVDALP